MLKLALKIANEVDGARLKYDSLRQGYGMDGPVDDNYQEQVTCTGKIEGLITALHIVLDLLDYDEHADFTIQTSHEYIVED